jgi:hypothetical protein
LMQSTAIHRSGQDEIFPDFDRRVLARVVALGAGHHDVRVVV